VGEGWRYSFLVSKGFIVPFSEAVEAGISNVGGKAYSLACCASLGICIPKGLVLSTKAYQAYAKGKFPDSIYLALQDQFKDTPRLIIRSSGIEEDERETSFAGQFLSVVSSNEIQIIKNSVEACWRSYSSHEADVYRKLLAKKKRERESGMAVLVQQLLNASASGVCFTADPLTGKKEKVIINSVHGLGETLMSGEVISDHYEFDVEDGSISRKISGEQTQWRSSDHPNTLCPLPKNLVGRPVLTDAQIEGVVHLAKSAESLLKTPLDVEWAFEGKTLYLLQVRPITSFTKKTVFTLWTRDNVADVIPDAVTPLTWSIVDDASNKSFNIFASLLGLFDKPVRLFELFDGRVYFNQTAYGNLFISLSQHGRQFKHFFQVVWRYVYLIFVSNRRAAYLKRSFPKVLRSISAETSALRIRRLKNHLEEYMAVHIQVVGLLELGFLAVRTAVRKSMPEINQAAVVDGIVKGLGKIESTYSGEALQNLAQLIMKDQALTEAIISAPVQLVPRILCEWGVPYREKWRGFLERFGHSSLKEFEIFYPRWDDDPSFIVETLKRQLCDNQDSSRSITERDLQREGFKAERLLLRSSPFVYYLPLKFYIHHIKACSVWRELLKQRIVKIMAEIRKAALLYATEKEIFPRENVFFISLDEVLQYADCPIPADLAGKAAERKNSWKKSCLEEPFMEIRVYPDGRQMKTPYIVNHGESMNGTPLSSGKYMGKARIVLDPADLGSFNWGDILVAPSTNPSWTPIFALAGAIVTDMGNYLSHGAIVARELGIPAVGNLFCATKRIKDGQIIAVDGDEGIIQIMGGEE
jgi:rifampicin phosphotransferase